jgi:hypothetical protein
MKAGTRIIGGVSAEFWTSGFGAQPDNGKEIKQQIMINIFRMGFTLFFKRNFIWGL